MVRSLSLGSVDCAPESVPYSTKAQAKPGPSIFVAGEL